MSKYIHPKLDHFLKMDARLIKARNPKLKKTEILNSLSKLFGWRHYNELINNLNKEAFSKELIDISKMEFDDLNSIKNNYFTQIYSLFPLDEIEEIYDPCNILKNPFYNLIYDPYNILKNPFYNLKNQKKYVINKGLGNKLMINLCSDEIYIDLENKDVEDLIEFIIERNSISSSMWLSRSKIYISNLMTAFKNDTRTLNFQEEFIKCHSLNYLIDYFKSAEATTEKKYLSGLENYIMMIPGYCKEDDIIHEESNLQHLFLVMIFFMFNKGFLKRNSNNLKTYKINELREHKGEIEFEYFDHKDYSMELKTFEKLILKK